MERRLHCWLYLGRKHGLEIPVSHGQEGVLASIVIKLVVLKPSLESGKDLDKVIGILNCLLDNARQICAEVRQVWVLNGSDIFVKSGHFLERSE